jgi:hypothetical protein
VAVDLIPWRSRPLMRYIVLGAAAVIVVVVVVVAYAVASGEGHGGKHLS